MFSELNAGNYNYSTLYYYSEFEDILSKMIACYRLMIDERQTVVSNENKIRDKILYNYLKKDKYKKQLGLTNYLFDPELPENNGRIDIRIMPVNPFISDEAYYIIECKRLNAQNQQGKTGLNAEYVYEGINRFTSSKYSSYYKTNGMLGFVVEPLDIHANIKLIEAFLKTPDSKAFPPIKQRKIIDDFEYTYCSLHVVNSKDVIIYHVMMDFSKMISN